MIRNRMPLRNLLFIVLVAIIFLMSCLGYALSIDNYRGNEERWILVGCIFGVFLLGGVATGIIMRKNMARVILLVILYLMVIGWTILGVIWFREIGNFQREMIKFTAMPIIFSISIYFLLFSFITFLNNPKLKEEFGIKEE